MDYLSLTIEQVSKLLREKKITSEQLVNLCFEKIEKTKEINALNSVYYDKSIAYAKMIDQKFANNEDLPILAGIPIVVKDNFCVAGYKNTCSSYFLKDFVAPYDAFVIKKLKENMAIIIAKANMDEFAMGGSNENSYFGAVHNPICFDRVAGGSSGGSAASVANNQCFASLGSDTGGSVRLPSSFCGVVGIKPTYSRVSRNGVVAFGSSFDQVGPITKTVRDNAIMLGAIAGYDKCEDTSSKLKVPDYLEHINDDIKGKKIGISKEMFGLGMDKEVEIALNNLIDFYKKLGAEIVEIKLDLIKYCLPVYYILSSAEASSNLGRFDGIRFGTRAREYKDLNDLYVKSRTQGFGDEVKRRIMIGNFVLSSGYYDAYYKKAQKVRQLISNELQTQLQKCDCILSPISPSVAFKLGEKMTDPLKMYLVDIFTVVANVTGNPAISFPCGTGEKGLPIGAQLIGKKFDESTLYNFAFLFENKYKGRKL